MTRASKPISLGSFPLFGVRENRPTAGMPSFTRSARLFRTALPEIFNLEATRGPETLCARQPLPTIAEQCQPMPHPPGGLYLMKQDFSNIHAANHEKMMPVCVCV